MSPSKVQLKKSQDHAIKLIGIALAVILLVTFVLSSSSMNLSASVTRPMVRPGANIQYPTKPAVPSVNCKATCKNNLQRCMLSQEGATNCAYIYDRCVSACTK